MRAYVCFDDTDVLDADRGTGKLARWYADALPPGCSSWGVVRQQLLVDPAIPYTSHNSSACVVVEIPSDDVVPELIDLAIAHVEKHMYEGSDPGVCVATESSPALGALIEFGRRAAVEVLTQTDAMNAAQGAHLSGHGGTEDGIIGAAAGVGLTAWGWSGRFIEFGNPALRDWEERAIVDDLQRAGMLVLPVERNVVTPRPSDVVITWNWVRPRLWGGVPSLPVVRSTDGEWNLIGKQSPLLPQNAEV